MLGFVRAAKFVAQIAAVAIILTVTSAQSYAGTGRVHINVVKAGFIVGVGGGSGTLTYLGKTYRLNVGGIGIGTIGFAGANLVGNAYNLRSAGDIAGTYQAAGARLAFVGGARVARLQNANGVILQLRGSQVGFEASLGLGGMTVSLQ